VASRSDANTTSSADGELVRVASNPQRVLLVRPSPAAGGAVPAVALIDTLWAGDPPPNAAANSTSTCPGCDGIDNPPSLVRALRLLGGVVAASGQPDAAIIDAQNVLSCRGPAAVPALAVHWGLLLP
jgi:hypothetical protein